MSKITIVHDREGGMLTIWIGDSTREFTTIPVDGVNGGLHVSVAENGEPLGFELLSYETGEVTVELETVQKTASKAA